MGKTIKQIADELGVSKQAVSKCIDNLGLRSTLTKNGNYFVVGDTQEKVIKQAFSSHKTANQSPTTANQIANQSPTTANQINVQTSGKSLETANQTANQSPTTANQIANQSPTTANLSIPMYTPIIETLQATIDTLQGQLDTKDKQLAAKDEQIRGHQAQIEQLTAALQQQTSALESTTAALTAAQALHAADKKTLMLMEDRENERKLSFWERRAAKKAEKKAQKEQAEIRRNEE